MRWIGLALLLLSCGSGESIPRPPLEHVDPDVVRAIEDVLAAVEHEPESAEAWGRLGDRYFVHDFRDASALAYARASALQPAEPAWIYRQGWSLVNDRPEEAARCFERALELVPDYGPAHEIYATTALRLGRDEEAIRHFTLADQLDPRSPYPKAGLGLLALQRGDLESARQHFEEALRRDPKHVEAHSGLAQAFTALGQSGLAEKHAEQLRKLPQSGPREDRLASPNLPPAGARMRTQYALQLQRQGRTEEAIVEFRLALESNPDHYSARIQLAKLLVKQERREEGLELLREEGRRSPDFVQARLDLAALEQGGEN